MTGPRLIAMVATLGALAACKPVPPVEIAATPSAGISIAIYRLGDASYAVVDDRREVEVKAGVLQLDHIDPGAALPSLVIEPLGDSKLVVGQCTRDVYELSPQQRIERRAAWAERRRRQILEGLEEETLEEEPILEAANVVSSVQCAATGTGPQLVRVLYVSSTITYRAKHEIKVTSPTSASLVSLFAIATPDWKAKAQVTLFAGLPGSDNSPEEIVRGTIHLDGATAVLAPPAREVPAQLRRVFGDKPKDEADDDYALANQSSTAVWVWLELGLEALLPGPIHVSVGVPGEEPAEVDLPRISEPGKTKQLRWPLWVDDSLRGMRARYAVTSANGNSGDRFVMSVANTGEEKREVWVEQKLRPARLRELKNAWPTQPAIEDGVVRWKLVVQPDSIERLGCWIEYVF